MRCATQAPSAAELAADVRAGRTSSQELVEQALSRLAECDGDLGAFVEVDAAGAREQAVAAASAPDAPLRGVPVAVKDLFDVRGQVTRAGSRVPTGPPATTDAPAVARLRRAGAVVLGRTRTHEFAWGITTQHETLGGTGNPWDSTRSPGGSSGGSAAAVAAGVVALALGTDTGCSIRLPAAWCGLVGHKPTWGAVPLQGCVPLAPSLDHGGALVRTVDDVRLWMRVLAGIDVGPPGPVAGLRAGTVAGGALVAPDIAELLRATSARGEGAGLRLREVALPLADQLVATYAGVQAGEALAWHRGTGRWPEHEADYGSDLRAHLRSAQEWVSSGRAQQAVLRREELRQLAAALFRQVDVLLLPVSGAGPPPTTGPDAQPPREAVLPWTVLANLCGLPACSVPVGLDGDGLPVGLQVVGPPGADALVLDVAERLQVPLPW